MRANHDVLGVVFDLDGTLINSEALNQKSREVVCNTHSLSLDWFDLHALRGVPVDESIDRIISSHQVQVDNHLKRILIEEKEQYVSDHVAEIAVEPYVEKVWEILHKEWIKLWIATSANRRFTTRILDTFPFLKQGLSSLLTKDDISLPKPHTEELERSAEILWIAPDNLLYIGDASTDEVAAKTAWRHFLWYTGTHSPDDNEIFTDACQTIATHQALLHFLFW